MLVLVTGIGNVGKSSFRRYLVRILRAQRYTVVQADSDGFSDTRNPQDTDLVEITKDSRFSPEAVYVIEDIHAFSDQALLPLDRYDLIFYVSTSTVTHIRFWLGRSWQWFKRGVYNWEPDRGFQGTRKDYDLRNLPGLVRSVIARLARDRGFIESDLEALRPAQVPTVCVDAHQTKRGPEFSEPLLGHFPETLRHT